MRLRLLSFNVQNRGDGLDDRRTESMARWLAESAYDIVLLQEVTDTVLKTLEEKLLLTARIGVGRDDGERAGEYVPILVLNSRFQVADSGWFWLGPTPHIPSRAWFALCPRLCTWAVLQDRDSDRSFLVVNNHWDHFSFYSRRRGWRQVLDLVREKAAERPFILGGDFNLSPRRPLFRSMLKNPFRPLRDAWHEANPDSKDATWRGICGGFLQGRVDHFLVSPEWQVNRCAILRGAIESLSDHRPIALDAEA